MKHNPREREPSDHARKPHDSEQYLEGRKVNVRECVCERERGFFLG